VNVSSESRFRAEDEYPHPAGSDPQYSESLYFNAVDGEAGYGVLLRIGNRINEGHTEVTVVVFLPDGGAVFHYARVPLQGEPGFAAGGLSVEIVEPKRHMRVRYAGAAHRLAQGIDLADPKRALVDDALTQLGLTLDFESIAPLFGLGTGADGTSGMGGAEEVVAAEHYEVSCRVSGTLDLDQGSVQFTGLGVRDHSWGTRRWQGPQYWRWLSGLFDESTAFVAWSLRVGAEREPGSGMIMRDGRPIALVGVEVHSEYGADPYYPTSMTVAMTAEDGTVTAVTGTVRSTVPLRNRRDGITARLSELVVEYRMGDRIGFGVAEYHDLILDGRPAGMLEA
jgi:hypothetical protein